MDQVFVWEACGLALLAAVMFREFRKDPDQLLRNLGSSFLLAASYGACGAILFLGIALLNLPWYWIFGPLAGTFALVTAGVVMGLRHPPGVEIVILSILVSVSLSGIIAGVVLAIEHPTSQSLDPAHVADYLARFACGSWAHLYLVSGLTGLTGGVGGILIAKLFGRRPSSPDL